MLFYAGTLRFGFWGGKDLLSPHHLVTRVLPVCSFIPTNIIHHRLSLTFPSQYVRAIADIIKIQLLQNVLIY